MSEENAVTGAMSSVSKVLIVVASVGMAVLIILGINAMASKMVQASDSLTDDIITNVTAAP